MAGRETSLPVSIQATRTAVDAMYSHCCSRHLTDILNTSDGTQTI